MGVMSLFGEVEVGLEFDERPKIPDLEFDKSQRLAFEKEMLGLYVSDHPLLGAEGILRRKTDGSVADLAECEDGSIKVFGGIVTGLQRKWTKRGDLMAVFTLEDLQSSCEVMVFPKTMTEHGHKLADDTVVCVKARVDKREEAPKLIAMELDVFEGDRRRRPAAAHPPRRQPGQRGPDRRAQGPAQRASGRVAGVPPPRRPPGAAPARPVLRGPLRRLRRRAAGAARSRRSRVLNPHEMR